MNLRRKRPRRPSSSADDIYELTPVEESMHVKKPRRKFRWWLLALRVVTYGFIGVVLLALTLYTAVRLFVKPQDIATLLKDTLEEQTGGRLDIGVTDFDVLTGITLSKIDFYPPAAGDTRGYRHGGGVEAEALAHLEALDIRYSIPRMFAGFFHLKALQLISPQVHLRQKDGTWNFDGILAYRSVNFKEEPQPTEPVVKSEDTGLPPWLMQYGPSLLFVPFEVLAQNIGIRNLSLDLVKEENGKPIQILKSSGLTIDAGLRWKQLKSLAWVSIPSPFEQPFEISLQDARGDAMVQTLKLQAALLSRVELVDLSKINLDYAMRVIKVETPLVTYEDLGATVKGRIDIDGNFKGVTLRTFNIDLLDAIVFDVLGKITLPKGTGEVIDLKLEEKLSIDITALTALAKPIVPGFTATGAIEFKDMWLEGTVEPAKLGDILTPGSGVQMPWVSAAMWFKDVALEYPALKLAVAPINGSVAIAGGPAMGSRGSQIDATMDLDLPKISATPKLAKLGEVTVGIENLLSKMTARVLLPEMTAPIFKLNVEADHVTTTGKNLASVDVPLYLDIDADGRQDLQRMSLNANLELDGLAELGATASCQFKCEKFRASANARLLSLQKLYGIALPVGALLGLQDVMPKSLSGALDFQLTARGKLPDPSQLANVKPADFINEGDVRFNSQFNISKLQTKLPQFNVALDGFETRLLASGTLQQQKIELSQKFESLSLELPAKTPEAKPQPISLSRFAFETTIDNEIDGHFELEKPLQQLVTAVQTKIFIGGIAADGLLPQKLSDLQVNVKASQSHGNDISIDEVSAKVPDVGAGVNLKAGVKLGPDMMPQSMNALLKMQVNPTGQEVLPAGIKTSGQIDIEVAIDSKDMQKIAVQGFTRFNQFNVLIPGKATGDAPLLALEEMNGQIPFRQLVDVPALQNQLEKKKAAKPEAQMVQGDKDLDQAAEEKQLAVAMDQYFEKNTDTVMKGANVAAMVDYGSIRPFFPDREPLSIKRIDVANLEMSNMEFDIELRQNWFSVNQFMINFLGGKIQGDFQLAFDPMPQSLRTSVHMTRLDTRKLLERFPNLKNKTTSWNLFSNPYIDGTVHFKYDLKGNDMSGGLEITSIGKEQLRMMLYYVDPFEQNPTIGDIRKALNFGEVRQVSVPIKNGEIDMDVDVRVLSAPLPTPKLTRFPISQIVQNFKDQAVAAPEEAENEKVGAEPNAKP